MNPVKAAFFAHRTGDLTGRNSSLSARRSGPAKKRVRQVRKSRVDGGSPGGPPDLASGKPNPWSFTGLTGETIERPLVHMKWQAGYDDKGRGPTG